MPENKFALAAALLAAVCLTGEGCSGNGDAGASALGGADAGFETGNAGGGPADGTSDDGKGGGGAVGNDGSAPSDGDADASADGHTNGDADGATGADLAAELLLLTQSCTKVVSQHTYALDDNQKVDICGLNGAVYFTADMDIDCDGQTTTQCNSSTDCCYQNDTAFHNLADQPLTASTTPYVVLPSDFTYPGLDRNKGGNVTAVIYKGQLQWAVFGDTGPTDIIGEASYACAKNLGIDPDPKTGGTGSGVLYITFVGAGTAPHDIEDQAETAALGQALAEALLQNN